MNTFTQKCNPLVSIIIPCYNGQDYVRRAVQSALNQTYNNTEIILVDNNSQDNTWAILNELQQKYSLKVRVYSEVKQGAPAARNKGLKEANGEWIQFLDCDDEIFPQKIEKQIQIACLENVGLVVGNFSYVGSNIKIDTIAIQNSWIGLIQSRLGITSANLWRRKDVCALGGFDEKLVFSSDEYDLMFRMLKQGTIINYDNNIFTKVYIQKESVSKSRNKERERQILENRLALRVSIVKYLKETGQLSEDIFVAYQKLFYYLLIINRFTFPAVYFRYKKEADFSYVPFSLKVKIFAKAIIGMLKKKIKI